MPDYKLVPVEPTAEMVEAAREHHEGESYLPVSLYKAMLAAAPAVQGEPVAWMTGESWSRMRGGGNDSRGTVPVRSKRTSVATIPLYAAPQPAPDVAGLVGALECMIIGACAVAVPHNGERAVLQDAVNIARAALAAHRKEGDES